MAYEVMYGKEHKDAVVELIESGMTQGQISAVGGMPSASVVYKWRKDDKKFLQRYDAAIATRTLLYFDKLQQVANDLLDADKHLTNQYTNRVKVAADILLKTAALVAPSVATPKGVLELAAPNSTDMNLQVSFVSAKSD